jgi:N6-L-threonylcarbamoyladenine synthase
MISLGIDTSNYATSLAVVDTEKREVVCALKRLLPVKGGQKGLRQSDAVFHHTVAINQLLQELESNNALHNINCVCASHKPRPQENSYMPCFLVGALVGNAFALAKGLKLRKTTHQEGHLMAAVFGAGIDIKNTNEFLFFHVSGGTTELLHVKHLSITHILGKSQDLYAGQAIDRLGVKLGFPFPSGQYVSSLAENCDEMIEPKISVNGLICSLSGLENKCNALIEKGEKNEYIAKFCLSYIAKTIVTMINNARIEYGNMPVLCAGGVMCSSTIRSYMQSKCADVYFTSPSLSADNAVGVALLGARNATATIT